MSTFGRSTNGRHYRHEPAREEDIVTPQKLAALIAAAVAQQLQPIKDEIWTATQHAITSAANLMIPKMAAAALVATEDRIKELADWMKQLTNKVYQLVDRADRAIGESATQATTIYDDISSLVGRGSENTDRRLHSWEQRQEAAIAGLAAAQQKILRDIGNAGVESLTALIGREVARADFESMIRDEVTAAVRSAIRDLNRPPLPKTPLTTDAAPP